MSQKSTLCSNVSYHVKSKNNMQRNLSICALKRGRCGLHFSWTDPELEKRNKTDCPICFLLNMYFIPDNLFCQIPVDVISLSKWTLKFFFHKTVKTIKKPRCTILKDLYMVWAVFGRQKWQFYGMINLQTPSLSKTGTLKFAIHHCAYTGHMRLSSAQDYQFSMIF